MENIVVALITGTLGLIGAIVGAAMASNKSAERMDAKLDKHLAVTDTKLEELTREVREHNGFAKRMPVIEEQVKVINHRIADLEGYHKGAQG